MNAINRLEGGPSPCRELRVPAMLGQLDHNAATLLKNISELEMRLSTILVENSEPEFRNVREVPPPNPTPKGREHLADRIESAAELVAQGTNRLSQIMGRLEI